MNTSNMYNPQQFQQPQPQQYHQYNQQQYVYGTNPQQPQVRTQVQSQPQQQTQPLQALSVKLYMPENEIRKTTFPRDITYEQVLERSLEFINKDRNQNKVQTNSLRVYYMDEEKEFVRFDSVAEWTEALKPVQSAPNGLLKIRVQIKDKKKKEDKKQEKPVTAPFKKEESVPQYEAPKPVVQPNPFQPNPFNAPQPQLAPFNVQQQPSTLFGGAQPTQSPPQNSPFASPQGTPQPQENKIGGDVHNLMRASFQNLLQQNPQKSNAPYATPTSQPVFPAPQYSPHMPTTNTTTTQARQSSPFQQVPTTSQPAPVFGSPQPTQSQTAHPHEPLLRELNDMGFTNREKNIELLTKHNGHLLNVINALMEQ